MLIKSHLEETIKTRLRSDINDYFALNSFSFNNKDDIQLNEIKEFLNFIIKVTKSMPLLPEYQKHFMIFNVNYMKVCFFESNSAGDRVR